MSSVFNLEASMKRAEARLGRAPVPGRKRRSDHGNFRLSKSVQRKLEQLLGGDDYPGVNSILRDLKVFCDSAGLPCPSRATIYNYMRRAPGPTFKAKELPRSVQDALYNLHDDAMVPGAQVAFYCFQYGNLTAAQYAAGLPWWPLYQAFRMRGWRAKSKGLLRAALSARGISRA
jgi:hypothetical protein